MSKITKSTPKSTLDAATLLAELIPKAAEFNALLAELQKAAAVQKKKTETSDAKKVKRAEKAAAKEAGVTLKSDTHRTAWTAYSAGDTNPEDGGEPVLAAKDAYPDEYAAWKSIAGLESGRGANTNFASYARAAHKGDPITAGGPALPRSTMPSSRSATRQWLRSVVLLARPPRLNARRLRI
jgi:hypothetical protein